MGRAAAFHDDQKHFAVEEPASELGGSQARGIHNPPMFIGYSQLEKETLQDQRQR